jgi:hypothetical protein
MSDTLRRIIELTSGLAEDSQADAAFRERLELAAAISCRLTAPTLSDDYDVSTPGGHESVGVRRNRGTKESISRNGGLHDGNPPAIRQQFRALLMQYRGIRDCDYGVMERRSPLWSRHGDKCPDRDGHNRLGSYVG